MKYQQVKDKQWVKPVKTGYRLMCCDCGLVHIVDFKSVRNGRGTSVLFRPRRDNRATASARRRKRAFA